MATDGKISVSKLDVAKRQLETALGLFFAYGDPISTHTLTGAAYDVLKPLSEGAGIPAVVKNASMIRPEKKKEYLNIINSAQNFFKHSSRDVSAEMEFNPDVTTYMLWDAIRMYLALVKERPCAMLAFTTWFYLRHPDLISNDGSIPTQFVGDTLNPDDREGFLESFKKLWEGIRGKFEAST